MVTSFLLWHVKLGVDDDVDGGEIWGFFGFVMVVAGRDYKRFSRASR